MADAELWKLSAQEAAAAIDGRLEFVGSWASGEVGAAATSDIVFSGVGTDTRQPLNGQLFIALKGEVHDAHSHIKSAIESGAIGLLSHRDLTNEERLFIAEKRQHALAVIHCDDTLLALQKLAQHWRRQRRALVLGITGTNGKTSTKEFAAAILSSQYNTHWSKGSFNNHWGVPFTLLSLNDAHEVAIVEMGMNHLGELKRLSEIVEADVVVCTMVGRGHLEGVGSVEGVAQAKAEIYKYAPANSTFIFNLDNEYTAKMMADFVPLVPSGQPGRRSITFAERRNGNEAGDVSFSVDEATEQSLRLSGSIRGVPGEAVVPVFGRHNVVNLMAASALALAAGMTPEKIWAALPRCHTAWGRNQWVELQSGARALFDAYNANPESMQAALENFATLTVGRRFAVLGEMRELGEATGELHREMARKVAQGPWEAVYFVGPSADLVKVELQQSGFQKSIVVSNAYENFIASELRAMLRPGDVVLLKGSRGVALEKFLADLHPSKPISKPS